MKGALPLSTPERQVSTDRDGDLVCFYSLGDLRQGKIGGLMDGIGMYAVVVDLGPFPGDPNPTGYRYLVEFRRGWSVISAGWMESDETGFPMSGSDKTLDEVSSEVQVEDMAQALHESGREAVENGLVLNAGSRVFAEWDQIPETAREGRRVQARKVLEQFSIKRKRA